MTAKFVEGFDAYGVKPGDAPAWYGTSFNSSQRRKPFAKVNDDCHVLAVGMDLSVCRLPTGKWKLSVNGVDMIFDQRPVFTIMERP